MFRWWELSRPLSLSVFCSIIIWWVIPIPHQIIQSTRVPQRRRAIRVLGQDRILILTRILVQFLLLRNNLFLLRPLIVIIRCRLLIAVVGVVEVRIVRSTGYLFFFADFFFRASKVARVTSLGYMISLAEGSEAPFTLAWGGGPLQNIVQCSVVVTIGAIHDVNSVINSKIVTYERSQAHKE